MTKTIVILFALAGCGRFQENIDHAIDHPNCWKWFDCYSDCEKDRSTCDLDCRKELRYDLAKPEVTVNELRTPSTPTYRLIVYYDLLGTTEEAQVERQIHFDACARDEAEEP